MTNDSSMAASCQVVNPLCVMCGHNFWQLRILRKLFLFFYKTGFRILTE